MSKRKKSIGLWWKQYAGPVDVMEIYWPGFIRDVTDEMALKAWEYNLKKFDASGQFEEFEKNRKPDTWPMENLRNIFLGEIAQYKELVK